MSGLRIDYSGLPGLREDADVRTARRKLRRRTRQRYVAYARGVAWALFRRAAFLACLAVLPFFVLIRGGTFAYHRTAIGTWPALLLSVMATVLLLGVYAWRAGRRLGIRGNLRALAIRVGAGLAFVYVGYALVYVASVNVKSDDLRMEYASIHPLLRVASSALILADPGVVITDVGRTPEDYWLMGLPENEASLHFEQATGYVHALDLRTVGRPEWRNRLAELAFWALGFHSLRHVGTADHLHVSLRLPE
jgi:hypothetical protein